MGDILRMSSSERRILVELNLVMEGKETLIEAARRIDMSYRQILRRNRRFKEEGEKGVLHRNRDKPSNHGYSEEFRDQCLQRIFVYHI